MAVRLDTSLLSARIAAEKAALVKGRAAALDEAARVMVADLVAESPRDTNRYVRGWILAGRGAGVTGGVMPALRESRVRKKITQALMTQLAEAKNFETMKMNERVYLESRGKARGRKYERILAAIDSAKQRAERAQDALTRFLGAPEALAMMRKYSYVLNGNQRHISGKALNIEVKDRVYGGEGALVHGPTRSVLRLHNLEPHATPVERRRRVLAAAKGAVSGLAVRSLRKKYIDSIRAAWKIDPRKAA